MLARRVADDGLVSAEVAAFRELKAFIYAIINQGPVSRQDWRARKVMTRSVRRVLAEPAILPDWVSLRATEELDLPYLRDLPLKRVAEWSPSGTIRLPALRGSSSTTSRG